ncbi:hypothetical protein LTS16_012477 [Friedmanniomyces endolithicus]|nr:hypothetical protein LTR75_011115 [Friedmanniomyces endolithicus]KAK0845818.1 hypothetical protein LTR03_007214 [Friedmanniomyces endolithicus]KAK0976976.1 hypothetical protein LTS01_013239 [Friedmanniomyces endolithicus]KAK1037860.1 hypothetical protein LTS16_012477 [Friedmanniomyces endolithicus]
MLEQNYGLLREGTGQAVLRPLPIPKLRNDYVLIRTEAIALNPTDWTTLDAEGDDGTIVGCDFAGVVEEVGDAVTKPFKKGDRVTGFAHGGNDEYHEDGAFARYITAKGDMLMRIPDGVGFESAATVAVGIGTLGYGLYHILGLPLPDDSASHSSEPVLVYGGINVDILQRDPNIGKQIHKDTNGKLTTVFDTVGLDSSAAICADAFGPQGGMYCSLLPVEVARKDVKSIFFLGYDLKGESYRFEGDTYPAKPEILEWSKKFTTLAEKLWVEGKWVPHPVSVKGGGVLGAVEGMQLMREGKGPSGEKWVYRVEETVWSETSTKT